MMLLLLLTITAQYELNPVEMYNLGNDYFEKANYSEAITAYEQASKYLQNARVFYNLGDAYFKKGMLGKAIINFRRAYFLTPRDVDVKYNLAFVRSYRVDKVSMMVSPVVKLLSDTFKFFSYFESLMLLTLFFVLASLLLSFYIVLRRSILGYAAIASSLLCLFFFISWWIWSAERNGHHAVITAPEVSALSGPGEDYKEIIIVHDGAEVKVREKRGDYVLIHVPGGVGGWVPVNALEDIFGGRTLTD
jgi:tetratricopeptide (TPR) repeat protein